MKGLIHIYTGTGKGKTTAATGLSIRYAGSGGKVLFTQFLKNDDSSEINILKQLKILPFFHQAAILGLHVQWHLKQKKKPGYIIIAFLKNQLIC